MSRQSQIPQINSLVPEKSEDCEYLYRQLIEVYSQSLQHFVNDKEYSNINWKYLLDNLLMRWRND